MDTPRQAIAAREAAAERAAVISCGLLLNRAPEASRAQRLGAHARSLEVGDRFWGCAEEGTIDYEMTVSLGSGGSRMGTWTGRTIPCPVLEE